MPHSSALPRFTFTRRTLLAACCAMPLGCSVPDKGLGAGVPDDTGDTTGAPGTIAGAVYGPDGATLGDAIVAVSPHGYETTTDADGSFTIDLLPAGTYTVSAWAPDVGHGTLTDVVVESGSTAEAAITLDSAVQGDVVITLSGPDGEPRVGATIQVGDASATTDDDGLATLSGLGGQTVSVQILDPELWPTALPDLTVPAGATVPIERTLSGRPSSDAEYVGSDACSGCHSSVHGDWGDTLHGQALIEGAAGALNPQDNVTVQLTGEAHALLTLGSDPQTLRLTDALGTVRDFDIDGWLGDPDHGSVPWTDIDGDAFPLPVAWVVGDTERPDWSPDRWVGWQDDTWLDDGGEFLGDAPDASLSAEARCFACHVTGTTLAARTDGGVDMSATDGEGRWLEAGVGCESCHGPASAHVSGGGDPLLITRPDLLDTSRSNQVCGQCHAGHVNTDGLPFAWEGHMFQPGELLDDYGTSAPTLWDNGAAAAPGQQYDELMLSAHGPDGAGLSCLNCHDVHGETGLAGMLLLSNEDNAICESCHSDLDDKNSVRDHTEHALYEPDSDQQNGRCTTCHMAPTAARLDFRTSSGAGDRSSHLFLAFPPQDTIDVFEAAGATQLDVGEFPIHGCSDCHEYHARELGFPSPPQGDPTLLETHQAHQEGYEERFE